MLEIKNLHAKIDNQSILKGVDLTLKPGQLRILMGPNGSGKSTLARALLGHLSVEVTQGAIELDGRDITDMDPNERSLAGLFMAFQYPTEVPGVNFSNFLRMAYNARLKKKNKLPVFKFRKIIKEKAELLDIDPALLDRNLNEGLSGGEKKKTEILQLAVLEPKYAILDETDSGLDIDALRTVFEGVKKLMAADKNMGTLVITHYQRIFDYIKPDKAYIMKEGVITDRGDMKLVERIVKSGYR